MLLLLLLSLFLLLLLQLLVLFSASVNIMLGVHTFVPPALGSSSPPCSISPNLPPFTPSHVTSSSSHIPYYFHHYLLLEEQSLHLKRVTYLICYKIPPSTSFTYDSLLITHSRTRFHTRLVTHSVHYVQTVKTIY